MDSIRHSRPEELPVKHHQGAEGYEYIRRSFVRRGEAATWASGVRPSVWSRQIAREAHDSKASA